MDEEPGGTVEEPDDAPQEIVDEDPEEAGGGLPVGQLIWLGVAATLLVGSASMGPRASLEVFGSVFGSGVAAAVMAAVCTRPRETTLSLAVLFFFVAMGAGFIGGPVAWGLGRAGW